MKKGFCILLALVLVLSLALTGCDAKKGDYDKANELFDDGEYEDAKELFLDLGDYEDSAEMAEECDYALIYGTWETELDMTDMINEMLAGTLGEEYTDSSIKFPAKIEFDFGKDKTCVLSYDLSGIGEAMKDWKATATDAVTQSMYDMAEQQGMSRDEFDEAFVAEYGATVPEYVEELMQEFDTDELVDSLNMEPEEQFFRLEDGKLYIAETEEELESAKYVDYSIDGDEMELDGGTDDELEEVLESLGMELPLILTRN